MRFVGAMLVRTGAWQAGSLPYDEPNVRLANGDEAGGFLVFLQQAELEQTNANLEAQTQLLEDQKALLAE